MNSRIKRTLSLLLIMVFVMLFPLSCAADSTVGFDEFGFSVTFPSDLIVFTRDTDPASLQWAIVGLDGDDILSFMESSDIYADALSPDFTYEITTIIRRGENYENLYNLNRCKNDEEILSWVREGFEEAVEETGVAAGNLFVYSSGELKYICFDLTNEENGQTVYGKSYMTVVNGISVQITLRSYDGPLGSSREKLLQTVVDSVQFQKIKSKPVSLDLDSELGKILESALVGGVTALCVSLPYYLFKKIKKGKQAEGRTEPISSPAAPAPGTEFILRCGNCGGELPQDVRFCPHCGWKIRD